MALLNVPPGKLPTPISSEFSKAVNGVFGSSAIKHLGIRTSQRSWPNVGCSNTRSRKHVFSKTSVSKEDGEGSTIVGDLCPLYSSRTNLNLPSTRKLQHSLTLHAVDANNKNGTPNVTDIKADRRGEVVRVTKETNVQVKINLDGSGISDCNTGIPFLDHMLDQIASHGIFDLEVKACGDIHIDDHHTNEDVALAFGNCLLQALGDRKGIYRFGDFSAPLDEALVHVALDLSGRPFLAYDLCIPTQRVGTYDTQDKRVRAYCAPNGHASMLVEHFFQSLVNTSGMTLHVRQLAGKNSHHIIEATFKAFARALRQATEYDSRRSGSIPSSKGILTRA